VKTISGLGQVEANAVADLSFRVSGQVSEILVKEGDTVQAGEVLAKLDPSDAQISYHQAELNLENAQISLQDLSKPPSDDDIKVAKANLASAQASYSSSQPSAQDLASAELKYKQAQDNYNAQQAARAHMGGTPDQITMQDAKVGQASFNMEIARLQLDSLQHPNNASAWSASLRIQQAELQLKQLEAGPSQQQIDSATIAVEKAQAALQDAQTTIDRLQLVAPISGVVTNVPLKVGDNVTPTIVVLEITDASQLWLTTPINELDVSSLHEGMPATIHLDALAGVDIPAEVNRISWLSTVNSDGITTYDTRLALKLNDPRIRIGMTGEAVIPVGEGS
jgi:HlyD family secretion protein